MARNSTPRGKARKPENPKTGGNSNTQKDPEEWTTGDEPMTGAQASYLRTLSEEAGVEFDETLTKAQASERIDEMQEKARSSRPANADEAAHAKGAGDISNTRKDPDRWKTGDEPMTGAQASYLKTLTEEAHEEFDGSLTKAEAAKRIDALQEKTGRGK